MKSHLLSVRAVFSAFIFLVGTTFVVFGFVSPVAAESAGDSLLAAETIEATTEANGPSSTFPLLISFPDSVGQFHMDGSVTLTGMYVCENLDFVILFGSLSQDVGRFTIEGFYSFEAGGETCDGTGRQWTARVVPFNGTFRGGHAVTELSGFGCGPFGCADQSPFDFSIRLRGGRP